MSNLHAIKTSRHRVAVEPSGDVLLEKPLPVNTDAERAVLGAILIDNSFFAEVASTLRVEHFFSLAHRHIFRAIYALAEAQQPIEPIALVTELRKAGTYDEAGGHAYVASLFTDVPLFMATPSYIRQIADTATERQLIRGGAAITAMAMDEELSVSEKINRAQQIIQGIEDPNTKLVWRSAGEVALERIAAAEDFQASGRAYTGLPTGLHAIDGITDGLQRSNLIAIGARPSMGKSALAASIALGVAEEEENNNPVIAYFTLEMSAAELVGRFLAMRTRMHSDAIRRGSVFKEHWRKVTEAQIWLDAHRIFIDDESAITPAQLRAKARAIQKQEGRLDLIVVDFLQAMSAEMPSGNLTVDTTQNAKALKRIAKNDFNVPLIAVASMNRGAEARGDKRPLMSDLRESGQIESEADVIMLLYRDDYYNPNSERQNVAEINFAKQRNGATGVVELVFLRQIQRFEDPWRS